MRETSSGDAAARAADLLASAEAAIRDGGNERRALDTASQALAAFRELRDQLATARALRAVAQLQLRTGEPAQALERADESLDLFLALHQRSPEEARAAGCAVEALLELNQPEAALRVARDTREALQEAGLRDGEALTLEALALVFAAVGQAAQAERMLRRALRLHAAVSDKEGQSRVLRSISALRLSRGAADAGGPAPVGAFAAAGDVRAAAEELQRMAETHAAAGRGAEVLAEAKVLRERCRKAGDEVAEGIALLAAAAAHLGLGQTPESLEAARTAEGLFEARGEADWWGAALAAVARAYWEKGQLQMTQQYARSATRKFAGTGKRSNAEVNVRLILAHSLLAGPQAQRRPDEALKEAESAKAGARELGDRDLQATAWAAITQAHSASRQFEDAIQAANNALQLLDEGDVSGRSQMLLHCADVYLAQSRFGEALQPAQEMVDLAKKDGDEKFVALAQQMLQKIERCQTVN